MKKIIMIMILTSILVYARNYTGVNPDYRIDSADVKGSAPKSLGAIVWDQLDQQTETGHSAQVFETHVGKQEYGTATLSYYSNKTYGLIFDVLSPTILKNVSVYPSAAGTIIIRVLDSSNTVVDSVITSATTAEIGLKKPVDLNFFLPAGINYKIDAKGTVPNLARNTSGGTYPFTSDLINIKQVIAGTATYYYFFYDWRMLAPEASNVGPVDKNIGAGAYVNVSSSYGLVFNVLKPSVLKSLNVYTTASGDITVRLLNSSNQVLQTKTVLVSTPNIKTKVELDFSLDTGTGYKIDAVGSACGSIWRNTTGVTYPYPSECVVITGAINGLTAYYYYFYDWEILDKQNKSDYDCEIAADFVLSEQTTIKRFKVKGWFENDTTANHVYKLRFYSNSGSSPSTTVLDSAITSLTYPGYEDIAAMNLVRPVTLSAGTYWVGFQALTDTVKYTTGDIYFSHRGATANSTQAYWRNPLDGYGTGNTGFTAMGYDICFALYSEKGICGYASGAWTTAGSPYYIDGDIMVEDDTILTLNPGVSLNFRDNYDINIQGAMQAVGTSADSIKFSAVDPSRGWGGIHIEHDYYLDMSDNDSTRIGYCSIQDIVAADGIQVEEFSKFRLYNSEIFNSVSNAANGVGRLISLKETSPVIEGNDINNNEYYYIISHSKDDAASGILPMLRNNIIRDNINSTGVYCYMSQMQIVNNIVARNGAAIILSAYEDNLNLIPDIINCTIAYNSNSEFNNTTGLKCVNADNADIINTVIYGNDQTYVNQIEIIGGSPDFYNCLTEITPDQFTGSGGGSNFSGQYLYSYNKDPKFLNQNLLTISQNSPCINGGRKETAELNLPLKDVYGYARLYNSTPDFLDRVDIGAVEYQGNPSPVRSTMPVVTPEPGVYEVSQTLALSAEPTGSVIKYSLNGSYPYLTYSSPISLSATSNLRAMSYYTGYDSSYVTTGKYSIYSNLVSDTVSGVWTKVNSPYYVSGDLVVPSKTTLTIEQGVEVIFLGYYGINVFGRILANGSAADSVIFKPDTTISGWKGISETDNSYEDHDFASVYQYCAFRGVNSVFFSDNCIIQAEYKNVKILNSEISGNSLSTNGLSFYNSKNEITGCDIFNNTIDGSYLISTRDSLLITRSAIHHNSITGNGSVGIIDMGWEGSEVSYCVIYENNAPGGRAPVDCEGNGIINNNLIYGNTSSRGGGIHFASMFSNYGARAYNNTITGNTAQYGGGIYCGNKNNPHLVNNIIYNNTSTVSGSEIYLESNQDKPNFTHCNIEGGTAAFYIEGGGEFKGLYKYCINQTPSFVNESSKNFRLQVNSACINYGTVVPDSLSLGIYDLAGASRVYQTIDIGAYEYQLSPNPLRTLLPQFSPFAGSHDSGITVTVTCPTAGALIYYTTNGTEPTQASALYSAPISISSITTLKARAYYGTYEPSFISEAKYNVFPGAVSGTILGGSWLKSGSPYYVSGDITIPDGYTLTIGQGVEVVFTGYYSIFVQGCLKVMGVETDSVRFRSFDPQDKWKQILFDNTPVTNPASEFNFAVLQNGSNTQTSQAVLKMEHYSNVSIKNCSFRGNIGEFNGAAVCVRYSDPVIMNSEFINNNSSTGSALYCYDSNPYIGSNRISYNTGTPVYISDSSPDIINNLITNNTDDSWGGGVSMFGSSNPALTNNTIANNQATYGGGGIYMRGYTTFPNPTIRNTIIYGNTGNDGQQVLIYDYQSQPEFNYCNIQGGKDAFGGVGASLPDYKYINNIKTNPKFVGLGVDSYALKVNSPSINAGSPDSTGMSLPSKDLAGFERIFDGYVDIIDIGAYEFNGLGKVQYSGTVSDSIRWVADIVEIAGNVSMSGIDSLKIVPGVHIDFKDNYTVELQDSLVARGTEMDKIVIENAKGGFSLNSTSKAAAPAADIRHWIYSGDETTLEAISINGYENVNIDSCNFTNVTLKVSGGATKAGASKKISNNSLTMSTAVKGSQTAILVDGDFDVTIINNQIINADSGIVVTSNGIKAPSTKKITNNSLTMSTAVKEGKGTSVGILLNNCTVDSIYHNSVYNAGVGVKAVNQVSSVTVQNNIFWNIDNLKVQVEDAGAKLILKNNDISGTANYNLGSGSGNINSNPLFVNAARGDLHLNSGSLCIDAGLNIPGLSYYNITADIGAYEYGLDFSSPYNLAATGDLGVINLSWTSPYSKKGITGYNIYRDGRYRANSAVNSYNDTGISNNVEYRYHVTAVYTTPAGESSPSNYITFTGLTTISPPSEIYGAVSGENIELNWVLGSGSKGLNYYKIYRDGALIDSTSATTYIDLSELKNMTTYNYYVSAMYEYPSQESTASDTVSVTMLKPPTSLSNEVRNSTVYLSWNYPEMQLNEGFEGTVFPPPGWSLIDANLDGKNWYGGSSAPHTGIKCAMSASYDGSAITPDNYLITKQVVVPENGYLNYYIAAYNSSYAQEHYSVLVSEDGIAAGDFTTNVHEETLPAGSTAWYARSIDMNQFAGKMINIAFRHYSCYDQWYLKLDDVEITDYKKYNSDGVIPSIVSSVNKDIEKKEEYRQAVVMDQIKADPINITGYKIYRNDQLIDEVSDPDKLYYYDNGLLNGSYLYTVKAVYSSGESSNSQVSSAAVTSGMTYLLNEGFETAVFPPAGWTLFDEDGDGADWIFAQNGGLFHTGTNSTASLSSEINASNWIISPRISVSGGYNSTELKFFTSCMDQPSEKYKVMISTKTANPLDFDTTVYEFDPNTKFFDTWYETTVDLSAYSGQNIYIAWVHCQDWGMAIVMDDITLTQYNTTELGSPSNVNLSVSGGVVTITWERIMKDTYMTYTIQSSTDLINWTVEEAGITSLTWSQALSGNKKFYRIIANDSVPVKKIIEKSRSSLR